MRGQSTVQVRRIERAGSWPLPSRTVRCDDEPRRPHGRSSCAMKPEFTGQVILRPTFAPRPGISHVLFDFDGTLVADPPGLARGDGADVHRGASRVAGRDRGRSRPPGLRGHHASQRQADHLPDDPARRANPRARRRGQGTALVQARIPPPARPPDQGPLERAAAGNHPGRRPAGPRGSPLAGEPQRAAACRSTWPAAPTRSSSSKRPSCWA